MEFKPLVGKAKPRGLAVSASSFSAQSMVQEELQSLIGRLDIVAAKSLVE